MKQPILDNKLDLPFETHYCPGDGNGTALVFTTEPAWPNEPNGPDRQQVDVLCAVEADNSDKDGKRASALARYIADALNHYVGTMEGMRDWQKLHPLMAQMRDAGRQ